jgi:hypothetical protein
MVHSISSHRFGHVLLSSAPSIRCAHRALAHLTAVDSKMHRKSQLLLGYRCSK